MPKARRRRPARQTEDSRRPPSPPREPQPIILQQPPGRCRVWFQTGFGILIFLIGLATWIINLLMLWPISAGFTVLAVVGSILIVAWVALDGYKVWYGWIVLMVGLALIGWSGRFLFPANPYSFLLSILGDVLMSVGVFFMPD